MIRGKDYIGVSIAVILIKNNQILLIKRAAEPY